MSTIIHRSSFIRALARLYSVPPIQAGGRLLATRYCLSRGSSGACLKRRKTAICQIMFFHRINDEGNPFLPATPVSAFRQQMEYLVSHFRIVGLDDIWSGVAFEKTNGFCVAVTFDDGYRDNFSFAFPILRELKIPATIYLASGYVDSSELPWYDQVCVGFKQSLAKTISLSEQGGPDGYIESFGSKLAVLQKTLLWLRSLDETARVDGLQAVFKQLRVEVPRMRDDMLTWDQVREMQKQGITFGGHTISHPALSKLSRFRLEQEIRGCKQRIETEIQGPARHFAYPFGRTTDIGPIARAVVRACGFQTAVTTEWGFNTATQDLFELRRCAPWETDLNAFALKFDWYRFSCPTVHIGSELPASLESAREQTDLADSDSTCNTVQHETAIFGRRQSPRGGTGNG